jgi:hypothetical protein
VAKVFLSHSSTDVGLARQVHDLLVDEGHEVFLDQHPLDGIRPGRDLEAHPV